MLEHRGYGINVWSSKSEKSIKSFFEFSGIKPSLKAGLEYSKQYNTRGYRDLPPTSNFFFNHTEDPIEMMLRKHIKFFLGNRQNKKIRFEFIPLGTSFMFLDHEEEKIPRVHLYPKKTEDNNWGIQFSVRPESWFFSMLRAKGIILTRKGLHALQLIVRENPNLLNIISDDELPRPPIA